MFAVIRTGGKQYKVTKDDVLDVERLAGDAGAKITFAEVLLLGGKGNTASRLFLAPWWRPKLWRRSARPRWSPSRRSGARTRIESAAIARS